MRDFEKYSDLDGILETMHTKFEGNWKKGRNLERARKHCVQNNPQSCRVQNGVLNSPLDEFQKTGFEVHCVSQLGMSLQNVKDKKRR